MFDVSVVIPTRNRLDSLYNLLSNLSLQTYPLKEVIIVDSSDQEMNVEELKSDFPSLNIKYFTTEPSVCAQRNIGVKNALSPYIFLCDDDININEDYLHELMSYLETNADVGAVSGLILQKEKEEWVYQYPPKSFGQLLFAFMFQHSVWGEVHQLKVGFFFRPMYWLIKAHYGRKNNSISYAGWPIITNFSDCVFHTKIYGLGASIVKREWLMNSPYDEVLDAHGIGDNYGVIMGFPQERAIHVVMSAKVYHQQSSKNRLDKITIYFRRVLALQYFLKKHSLSQVWFMWSLIGYLLLFLFKFDFQSTQKTLRAIRLILTGKNPYHLANNEGQKST